MVGGVRVSHAAAASAAAALLLLLVLARLPPPPPRPPAPHPRLRVSPPPPPPPPPHPRAADGSSSSPAGNVTSHAPPSPAAAAAAPAAPADARTHANANTAKAHAAGAEKVIYTKAGGERRGTMAATLPRGALRKTSISYLLDYFEGKTYDWLEEWSHTEVLSKQILISDIYESGHVRPHPELCPRLGAGVRLLVAVASAPAHAAARRAVRLTWGHCALRSDVALAFMLGRPPPQYRAALDEEDAIYGDLVMGAFEDSYSNLTLKSLSMLEWARAYCPRARRLLKTDDDMFINVPRLLAFIAAPGRVNATKTVWGRIIKKSRPQRKSKYYLPRAQFAGSVLPDFATGPAYLVTGDAVAPLLAAAPAQPYVRLEDVFVTGVLADRVGLRRVHATEFYNKKVSLHPCGVQRGISIHMVQYHEQFELWRKLLDGRAKCS